MNEMDDVYDGIEGEKWRKIMISKGTGEQNEIFLELIKDL